MLAVTPIGLTDAGAKFDIGKPYTGCRLCGALYQTDADRNIRSNQDIIDRIAARRDWSFKHARKHPQWEHEQLELSGAYMTPDAAMKLASFGIISLSDMALVDEHWHAGRESHRMPHNDVEGGS
jgi:hypothetical protein